MVTAKGHSDLSGQKSAATNSLAMDSSKPGNSGVA
jgi:hypothetical protein